MEIRRQLCCILSMILALTIVTPDFTLEIGGKDKATQTTLMKLNDTKVTLYEKEHKTLKVLGTTKKVKWSSNKPSVASVNGKGVVTTKKKGAARITAQIGKKKLYCTIVVRAMDNKKLHKMYKKMLEDWNNGWNYYTFYDFDGDGLDELIVTGTEGGLDGKAEVLIEYSCHAYSNGKIVCFASGIGQQYIILSKKKKYYYLGGHPVGNHYYIGKYKFEGKKAKGVYVDSTSAVYDDFNVKNNDIYSRGSKTISAKQYKKIMKSFASDRKTVRLYKK